MSNPLARLFKQVSPNPILSLHHPLVSSLLQLRDDAAHRLNLGALLVSSNKLLKELIHRKVDLPLVLTLPSTIQFFGCRLRQKVGRKVLQRLSALHHPPDDLVIGVLRIPKPLTFPNPLRLALVLENIQDPGCLGSLLRSAEAFGFQGVIFLHCVSPFHPKCVSASQGVLFHLPYQTASSFREVLELAHQFDMAVVRPTDQKVASSQGALVPKKGVLVSLGGPPRKCTPVFVGPRDVQLAGALLMYRVRVHGLAVLGPSF